MKTTKILFALVGLLLFACGKPSSNENNKVVLSKEELRNERYQQVIAVHDEVMPKMEDIINLQEKIRIRLDSIQEVDTSDIQISRLKEMNTKLEQADKLMMEWMRAFDTNINSPEVNQEEAMEYLNNEMIRIEEVKEVMNATIAEIQELLLEE